jgi:hypothetical protein
MSEDGRALRCEPEAVGSASKDVGTSRKLNWAPGMERARDLVLVGGRSQRRPELMARKPRL